MIAEKTVSIVIEDKTYTLRFDVNCMCAYEEVTKQFFLEACTEIMECVFPKGSTETETRINPGELVRKLSMVKLRALLWSAMHDYDKNDNPVWPLTINQVGKLINITNIVQIFRDFLKGNAANQPSSETLGESQADVRQTTKDGPPNLTGMNGGDRSIELPASAFDLTNEK